MLNLTFPLYTIQSNRILSLFLYQIVRITDIMNFGLCEVYSTVLLVSIQLVFKSILLEHMDSTNSIYV